MDRKLSLILTSPHRYRRNEPPIKRDMDSGWAWIVLSATFVSFFTGCGLGYNIGIYFVCFLNAFQESRAYTAWINAVYATVFQISGKNIFTS